MKLNYFFGALIVLGIVIVPAGIITARAMRVPEYWLYIAFFGGAAISMASLFIAIYLCHCRKNNNIIVRSCQIHGSLFRD